MATRRSVESTWRGGLRADVDAGGFALVVDEPESVGGTNTGPQPTEVLLASVASCFTLALAYSAKKQAVEVTEISVTATGIYDGPRFRAIAIASRIGCDPADVPRLVSAAERVCYVTNTLKSGIDISVEATTVPQS